MVLVATYEGCFGVMGCSFVVVGGGVIVMIIYKQCVRAMQLYVAYYLL